MPVTKYLIIYDKQTGKRTATVRHDLDFLYNPDGSHVLDQNGNWAIGEVDADDSMLDPHRNNLAPGLGILEIPIQAYRVIGADDFLAQFLGNNPNNPNNP